jgi:hypothetical protein
MFRDTTDGQTHSFNDGCGEPEHNEQFTREKELREGTRERFFGKFNIFYVRPKGFAELGEEIVDFIEQEKALAVQNERREIEEWAEIQKKETDWRKIEKYYYGHEKVAVAGENRLYNLALIDLLTHLAGKK